MAIDLSAAFFQWASSNADLANVLGISDAFQLYPVATQEAKTPPYAVYQEEKDAEYDTQDDTALLASTMLTLSCVGSSAPEAASLAELFRDALTRPRFSGVMGAGEGAARVQTVFYKGSSASYQWAEQQFAVDVMFKFEYELDVAA